MTNLSNNSAAIRKNRTGGLELLSWAFGILVFFIGLVNCFWGNDPFFGVFLVLLSFVYFPPVMATVTSRLKIRIPGLWKILLAIFIIWASVGVGELFDKVDMMLASFN